VHRIKKDTLLRALLFIVFVVICLALEYVWIVYIGD